HVTDVGLVAIVAPADTVDSGALIQPAVRLGNYGTRVANLPVRFMMGYGADTVAYLESLNVVLAPAAESVVVFSSALRPARVGRWWVTSWHRLAGDQHPENDSLARPLFVRPPGGMSWPPGWREVRSMPLGGGRDIKGGGALTAGPGAIYATKGNKTSEFYSYNYARDSWATLAPVPPGHENKPCDKGCRIASDGGSNIYLVKGNNTLGFFRYSIPDSGWTQLEDVPVGTTGKKVKGGTDLVYVPGPEVKGYSVEKRQDDKNNQEPGADGQSAADGYLYLLKGYKNEFHRFNITTGHWETMQPAPGAIQKWDKGSFLVYDNSHTIYAHKSKYNELWRYDTDSAKWGAQLTGMPFYNSQGKKKKAKDGSAGAWFQGSIYALKGGNTQEFWRYFAGRDSWAELETLPMVGSSQRKKKVKDGGDLVFGAYAFWALKGNKTRELWRYGIPLGDMTRLSDNRDRVLQAYGSCPRLRVVTSPLAERPVLVYTHTEATVLTARVYDAAGRLVAVPLTGYRISGPGSVRLSTGRLASGVYLLQVTAGDAVQCSKLVVR
ncbi:MAG: T9SS type A sorting domain-containing protein, partial [candidate division WOR-3 bacterium]